MGKSKKYSYVGMLQSNRRSDFPLLCGVCTKEIHPGVPVAVYFDNGPGDFFLVDMWCAGNIDTHDDGVSRLAQKG